MKSRRVLISQSRSFISIFCDASTITLLENVKILIYVSPTKELMNEKLKHKEFM